ncbi:MAG TPA: PLP-dependent transferase [Candidatus Saccharimonadales bacterium]|nr:PLP-dependent transferase [Candidatus Saccharimonadales bacterium]
MLETYAVEPIVPDFDSIPELESALTAKAKFDPQSDLYPRDGSSQLGEIEAKIANLAGVNARELIAYNSGMSAVTEALDVAIKASGTETPTVAVAQETYTQTRRYIDHFLRGAGPRIVFFDSGDRDDVANTVERHHPDVIIAETVANYTGVPVLDTDFLLKLTSAHEKQPTVILDNTLPLSTAQPLGRKLAKDERVIVVESGTKSYTFNAEQLGIGFTKNEELLDYLRRLRRTRGSIPGAASLERIEGLIPTNTETFNERNLQLFKSTAAIAIELAVASEGKDEYFISHPTLKSHPNHEDYRAEYPNESTPVFYIVATNGLNQYQLGNLLWQNPAVREQAKLGQSFGFDHTRIVTDENQPQVRIAGGVETNGKVLGQAMADSLAG